MKDSSGIRIGQKQLEKISRMESEAIGRRDSPLKNQTVIDGGMLASKDESKKKDCGKMKNGRKMKEMENAGLTRNLM